MEFESMHDAFWCGFTVGAYVFGVCLGGTLSFFFYDLGVSRTNRKLREEK